MLHTKTTLLLLLGFFYTQSHAAQAHIKQLSEDEKTLYWACYNGELEIVQELLNKWISPVNPNFSESGNTPLIAAMAKHNHDKSLPLVIALLKAKATVNMMSPNGALPLHNATSLGETDIVNTLIAADADPKIQDMIGCTPLHYAAKHSRQEIALILLYAGAKPYTRSFDAETITEISAGKMYAKEITREKWGIPFGDKDFFTINPEFPAQKLFDLAVGPHKKDVKKLLMDKIISPQMPEELCTIIADYSVDSLPQKEQHSALSQWCVIS